MKDNAFVEIYQLPDEHPFLYGGLQDWQAQNQQPNVGEYNHVYLAPLEDRGPETIFFQFHNGPDKPKDTPAPPDVYFGRQVSVSDVVGIHRGGATTYHYCNTHGFEVIQGFAAPEQQTFGSHTIEGKIHVLLCYPDMVAVEANIDNTLEAKQMIVGGRVDRTYPSEIDLVAYIYNDDGLDVLKPSRALTYPNMPDELYGFVSGPLIVAGLGNTNFESLSPFLIKKYGEKLYYPEGFTIAGETIIAWSREIAGPNPYEKMPWPEPERPAEPNKGGKPPKQKGDGRHER